MIGQELSAEPPPPAETPPAEPPMVWSDYSNRPTTTFEPGSNIRRKEILKDLKGDDKLRYDSDIKAVNILLLGLPVDIYTLINHYQIAKFTSKPGESIHSYYRRFAKLINDMNMILMTMTPMQIHTKFVNHLRPEGSRLITAAKQARNLHKTKKRKCQLGVGHLLKGRHTRDDRATPLILTEAVPLLMGLVYSPEPSILMEVARKGRPRMIGTVSSPSISNTTKSTRKMNLSIFTSKLMLAPRSARAFFTDKDPIRHGRVKLPGSPSFWDKFLWMAVDHSSLSFTDEAAFLSFSLCERISFRTFDSFGIRIIASKTGSLEGKGTLNDLEGWYKVGDSKSPGLYVVRASPTFEFSPLIVVLALSAEGGDANHIRTLGDYSKPSHKGYRNTIKLPVGNNVVPLRSDTIRKIHHQMGGSYYSFPCSIISIGKDRNTPQRYPDVSTTLRRISLRSMDSFQGLTPKSPSLWHPSLASDLNFYDHVPFHLKCKIDCAVGGEKERNDNDDMEADGGINRTHTEMQLKEAEKETEAVNETKNKPIKRDEGEETAKASSSQPVGYLKHRINEKLIEGLVDIHRRPKMHERPSRPRIQHYVMPLSTYMKLADERPAETDIRLFLASHSYIYPLGIAEDMLVDVVGYVYHVDFVILDIKKDEKRPFILGTPFLTTAKAVIKFDKGTITLRSEKSKISFHRIPESLCKVEKGTKNDIELIALTMTMNRLVLEWEEKIKLHQEKEIKFDQWRSKNFINKHPALVKVKNIMDDKG
uniref:Reverse transcriptase domain-containing protein n=1 Tax=Tanacetum cinerariifolium TaxID=118510 RepID=A0A6L2KU02_TANCI|nr:hypothetical protein [Tanacetum cinerariifolium]